MRFIGVDLHTTQLTVCYLKTVGDYHFKQYRVEEIERFLADLAETDQLAVEATGNSRWLVNLVAERVSRAASMKRSYITAHENSVPSRYYSP